MDYELRIIVEKVAISSQEVIKAGHDHQLRFAVSHIHRRAWPAPCRTDSSSGTGAKYRISGAIWLA